MGWRLQYVPQYLHTFKRGWLLIRVSLPWALNIAYQNYIFVLLGRFVFFKKALYWRFFETYSVRKVVLTGLDIPGKSWPVELPILLDVQVAIQQE